MTNEELVEQIQNGVDVQDNMQKLYDSNRAFIVMRIKKYSSREPLEDLMQQSYIALHNAAQSYDSDKGSFLTYFGYCLQGAMTTYFRSCGIIYTEPISDKALIGKLQKLNNQYYLEHGEYPTEKHIAAILDISEEKARYIKYYAENPVCSLDAPIDSAGGLSMVDSVPYEYDLEDYVIEKQIQEKRERELWDFCEPYLDDWEYYVIVHSYKHNETAVKIAKDLNCTGQYISQVKRKALNKLRFGKAKLKIREKFEIRMANVYRGGATWSIENNTSVTEETALHRIRLEEMYNNRRYPL